MISMAAQQFPPRQINSRLWRALIALTWATWWGGLTFYAAAVVPIGSRLLGKATQGLVTQPVTLWINRFAIIALGLLFIEGLRSRCRRAQILIVITALCLIPLHLLHNRLSGFLADTATQGDFYSVHRIYLWITALQWLTGGLAGAIVLSRRNPEGERPAKAG
jgi:hypothetical protein